MTNPRTSAQGEKRKRRESPNRTLLGNFTRQQKAVREAYEALRWGGPSVQLKAAAVLREEFGDDVVDGSL